LFKNGVYFGFGDLSTHYCNISNEKKYFGFGDLSTHYCNISNEKKQLLKIALMVKALYIRLPRSES
jgi:hypothetical protein